MNLTYLKTTRKNTADNALRLKQAIGLVWKSTPGWTLASTVLIIFQGSLPLATLYLMKLIVDSISSNSSFEHVIILIGLAGGVALLMAICNTATEFVSNVQSILVAESIQEILHAKSVEVDLEFYENPKYYEALYRAQQEAPVRPILIVNGLLQVGRSCISLGAIIGLILSMNWIMALVLMVAALPSAFVQAKYASIFYRWQRNSTTRERKAWYRHWLLTNDSFAKEIRLFNLGSLFMRQYKDLIEAVRREKLAIISRKSAMDLGSQAIAQIAVFGSLAFIAHQALLGSITLGSMVMYFGAVQQGQSTLSGFFSNLARLYENNLFLANLQEFLQLEPNVIESANPMKIPDPIKQGILFENVSFNFPGSGSMVLKNVNLQIRPGQFVALVGGNGSGKSTIIKLLCRLYDPQEGRISLDGIDLKEFSLVDLRQKIGILFQDYARYNLTAKENIWLGNADEPLVEGNIIEAAEFSGADEFITCLEDGYDTILGKLFENGTELSVGQWQKMALARAFLRDSQIVILDEPTSSLDPKSEDNVIKKFNRLIKGRMALVISHRLSTVDMADCIYVIKDGRIIEHGTHQELLDLGGEYAQQFEIQAKHYKKKAQL